MANLLQGDCAEKMRDLADNSTVTRNPTTIEPSNTASLREALEKIYELVMQIVEKTEDADVACDAWDISELCENALDAPPRNCDIGTPAEQNEKFLDSEDYNDYQKNGAIAAFVWGQKPCENE